MKIEKLAKTGLIRRYMQLTEGPDAMYTKAKDHMSVSIAAASVINLDKTVYKIILVTTPAIRGNRKLLLEINPDLAAVGSVHHTTLLSEGEPVQILVRSAGSKVEELILSLPWVARFTMLEIT